MIRNEYRRGLIMLRPFAPGYSGHVRLERRTLMGSMYFIIGHPEVPGDFRAVLAGHKNGEYFAAELGMLRRDGRGQATLAYSFDPRNIDGRPLEDYMFVIVARVNICACETVLSGNVDGSREADIESVKAAVCALLTVDCGPAADIPERPFPTPQLPAGSCCPDQGPPPRPYPGLNENLPQEPVERPYPRPDVPEQEPVERPYPRPDVPKQEPVERPYPRPDVPEQEPVERPYPRPDVPEQEPVERPYPRPDVPEQEPVERPYPGLNENLPQAPVERPYPAPDVPAFSEIDRAVTAAEAAGIDTSAPWASAIEGIRALFAGNPPEKRGPDDDYIYVRAPMPAGSGFDHVLVGIEADDGRVERVQYALPARFSDTPPAGLDGYVWMGGPMAGWWVLTIDPQTGLRAENDD